MNIWQLAIIGYVLIGGIVARRTFVTYINAHGRNHKRYYNQGRPVGEGHDPFAGPFWAGVFWPIVVTAVTLNWLWDHTIARPTATERKAATAKAAKAALQEQQLLDAEAERLGLPTIKFTDLP